MNPPTVPHGPKLAARLHPRASLMTEESAEVGVLFDITAPSLGSSNPTNLVLVAVGKPPQAQAKTLSDGVAALQRGAGPQEIQLVGLASAFGGHGRGVHTAGDLAAGLALAESIVDVGADEGRILLLINADHVGNLVHLDAVATSLGERRLPVDLVCTDENADLGLLTAVAGITGGELLHVGREGGAEAFLARVDALQRQPVRNLRLVLNHAEQIQPRLVFRLVPRPALLQVIDPNEHRGPLVIPMVPAEPGISLSQYFVSVTVPRPRTGDYQVFDARLIGGKGDQVFGHEQLRHRSTLNPEEALMVEAAAIAAQEKAEAIAWVEEMAQAANQGDVRRVANLLERVVLRAAAFGRDDLAALYSDIRRRFLRSGVFGRLDANALRKTVKTL